MALQARTLIVSLLAALALASAPAWAGNGSFGEGQVIDTDLPQAIAVGDFNADGRPDLAAARFLGSRLDVLLGAAGGGFMPGTPIGVGRVPTEVAVADFNADGRDDLAVANRDDYHVSVRLGQAGGTFAKAPDLELTRHPFSLAVGDFNADNKEDLAIAIRDLSGAAVTMRLGVGDGTFSDLGEVSARGGPIVVGDFNADTREDLAFGTYGSQPAGVLIGTGTGTFTPGGGIDLPGLAGGLHGLAVGDFDSDGNQDVAAAVSEKDVVSVRLGNGEGAFGGSVNIPVGDDPSAVAVGHFDSDGNEDLAIANAVGDSVSVRLGDGAGRFENGGEVAVGDHPRDIALADFDRDGNEDIAVANFTGDTVSVHLGLGPSALAGNLLANGGFEGSGAAAVLTQSPAIPGWTRMGGMTFARYGLPSHAYFPSRLASPRYLTGGQSLLWGGNSAATGGITHAAQTVDVSDSAGSIDANRATAGLSAYLGGALAYGDRMAARAEFLNADGTTLGSLEIGPVTATDRNDLTTLVRRAGRAPVPVGTRQIRVTLTSTDDDKNYSSAIADNVTLTLDAPASGSGDGPGSGDGDDGGGDDGGGSDDGGGGGGGTSGGFGSKTLVTLKLAANRIPANGPVKVRVASRNGFAVTGKLSGRTTRKLARAHKQRIKLKAKPFRVGAHGRQTVALKLPKPLRKHLKRKHQLSLRLMARVEDPASDTRTVKKRVKPKLKKKRRR